MLDIHRISNDAILAAVKDGTVTMAAAVHETTLRRKTGSKLLASLNALGSVDETVTAEAEAIASAIAERKAIAAIYFDKAFDAAPPGRKVMAAKTAYRKVMKSVSVDAAKRAGRAAVQAARVSA